jgi:hypothetical protein
LTLALHRVFPWDPVARSGEPFAPDHFPARQGSGRFDLRDGAVLYLGETPEHPVAELLQAFRGRPFRDGMLRRFGHPLALVEILLPEDVAGQLIDLDDPAQLMRFGLRPSEVASDDRRRTGRIAAAIHDSGATGLRWWSKLSGDWHGAALFLSRVAASRLTIGAPARLSRDHPAVIQACRHLAIELS